MAREETPHAALVDGIGPGGTFSGASVFVVCRHGALLGRAGNFWQDALSVRAVRRARQLALFALALRAVAVAQRSR